MAGQLLLAVVEQVRAISGKWIKFASPPARTPRTQAQAPSYALKIRRVLQLRKPLADKREDHVFTAPDGL